MRPKASWKTFSLRGSGKHLATLMGRARRPEPGTGALSGQGGGQYRVALQFRGVPCHGDERVHPIRVFREGLGEPDELRAVVGCEKWRQGDD